MKNKIVEINGKKYKRVTVNEASVYKQSDARGVKKALDTLISPLFMQVRFSKAHKNSEVDSVIQDVLDDFKSKLRRNTGIKL
tara:strand:- start:31 stop:276 length:246 start_codon:yes stop_codon:yes gene_type:complete